MLNHLRLTIQPLRQALLAHPIYDDLRSAAALRTFMEHHVFAVWDFMSLLKALQQRLTCVSVPWLSGNLPVGSRLVNEIVLGEETDEDGQGGYASHFDLYHRAMTTFGAGTDAIDRFLQALRAGHDLRGALQKAAVGAPIQAFVLHTFQVIETGDVCRIAAAFTFGREDLLPDVFQRIVAEANARVDGKLGEFEYYLQRHIALDGESHGPMAERLMASLCGGDEAKWRAAAAAAVAALEARLALWDAIHSAIKAPPRARVA